MPMPLPSYRLARREDIPALIALFETMASEMPVHGVPGDQIHKWASSGNSAVALLGPSRELVGFVLGDLRRHSSPLIPGGEPQPHGISLFYAGVAPERRGQGIFSMMISVLQRRGRPLFGRVHTANKFQVRHRLQRLGFHYVGRARAPFSFDAYRWIPG